MTSLLESNLVQVLATFLAGAATYMVGWAPLWLFPVRWRAVAVDRFDEKSGKYLCHVFDCCIVLIFLINALCFLFSLGEFYQYCFFYKRSFGFFGDGFPFVMVLFLLYALRSGGVLRLSLCIAIIFMNGSKIVLILSIVLLFFFMKRTRRYTPMRAILVAFLIYWSLLFPANYLVGYGYNEHHPPSSILLLPRNITSSSLGNYEITQLSEAINGEGACSNLGICYGTQVAEALNQRLATGTAGLWMTLKGGYSGADFPNTAEKFADLMMANNPWGVNEILGMSRERWERAGGVQLAFLNFSSGYGPFGLLTVVLVFGVLSILALRQMACRNYLPWKSLSAFFILLVFCNQSQPWLQSKSVLLFLSGLAAMHIIMTEYNTTQGKKLIK